MSYKNLRRTDVSDINAKNETVICIITNCYEFEIDTALYESVSIDGLAFLVEQTKFQDAWLSNKTFIKTRSGFYNYNGYIPFYDKANKTLKISDV